MKKKIISLIIITIAWISFFPINVNASVNHGYSLSFVNDCVSKHTCILLCGYTNRVRTTAEFIEDPNYNYFSSYIYYNLEEKTFFTEWLTQETDLKYVTHNASIDYKNVYFQDISYNNLKEKGKCPINAFIDVAGMSLAPELCYSNDSNYCIDEKSNAGTKFKGDSTNEYNYENSINTYFETWAPDLSKYTCEDLREKNIDIKTQFVTDFSKNFLYSNAIPNFIENSKSYQDGLQSLDNKIVDFKETCDEEAKEEYEEGNITEEELEQILKENEDGAKELDEQLEDATEDIEQGENQTGNNEIDEMNKCSSLLGDPNQNEPATPAYYLSFAFSVIRYVAIILLIVLTTMDFVSAVASQDNDILKKTVNKTIKRAVLCVVIFLLPTLISFVLQFMHDSSVHDCINFNS